MKNAGRLSLTALQLVLSEHGLRLREDLHLISTSRSGSTTRHERRPISAAAFVVIRRASDAREFIDAAAGLSDSRLSALEKARESDERFPEKATDFPFARVTRVRITELAPGVRQPFE